MKEDQKLVNLLRMRHPRYETTQEEALSLMMRAPYLHFASTDENGRPIGRTLHAVFDEQFLYVHGSDFGEKVHIIGQPCVVWCEEVFARIPSYFLDEERACPATTYYQSAMLHGVCELVEQHEQKAHVLAILMQRFQPEGRYTPLSEPLYRKSIEKLAVFRVPTTNIVGKFKVGQNRPPLERQRVMQKLWERGQSGDILTICKMLRADHTLPTPSFLLAPERCVFELDPLSAGGMDDAVDWLRQTYWNQNISVETLRRVHLHSTWIMVRDNNGAFVATARATSDRGKSAWIYDVFVHPTWRGKGLGKALLRLLLDHPDVRMVRTVFLGTKDAQGFYKSLGFHEGMLQKAYESSTMWLRQNSTE